MVFIWFHNHCKLASLDLKLKEHMWDLSNKLGQLPRILFGSTYSGFHMDLLALFLAIWTYSLSLMVKSLFWGGDTTLYFTVSHCGNTTLLNQAPYALRARPVRSAGWGCSLLEVATTGNYSNIRRRSSFIYGSLGFILLLCFCSTATYYFGICCQFSSNFGL